MSDMKSTLRGDLKEAMKAKDKNRTGTIRMLLAAIQEEETKGAKRELGDEEVLKVIAREIKKRRESAEVYAANGRQELADAELAEVEVLRGYQPEQLDDAALAALVAEVIAEMDPAPTMKQMGQVMKQATARAAGRADGKRLSGAVKSALSAPADGR
ncbi:GatB/YqeY domain-containing protein [Corynebacterium mastitidis]|uniref:Glutamyl-tRNA amidotransferase n=1 Tax=Corynebacterium mastitidis TaxID=161890 RepID=A0A2N0X991_9CORY|nr:GatB/YqeY domain-containing protein [Corynebacterium mastitidis]MCH6197233.1 GatB/YqeY domain-containing protein [Corynebacterium mastitidis]PKF69280.1 glutamyl-tRNA amidotransferase [Corynebacterium mastitidis]